jgi:hypothetical protein
VDTRTGQGKTGQFGPPALSAYTTRNFELPADGCAIPATAQAYALNVTAVPTQSRLDFLSMFPEGQSYPGVSTLNSPRGNTIANAAIVPAGTNGGVSVVAGQATNLIIDINGYFAPPADGGLHFFPVVPCRVMDTRPDQGKSGPFGPPALIPFTSRDVPINTSSCNIPTSAAAYSLNFTVVPQGSLQFLSAYPAGQGFPGVSTLNSPAGNVLANAGIIPAGPNGAITVLASDATDLIIDINGYFAP